MPTDDPPDPTTITTPGATPAGLAELEASIARTEAEWQRLRAGSYEGGDPARLVTCVVDGEGLVVRVTFAPTVARHDPAVVEDAVLAAVAAAQQRLGDACAALAAGATPSATVPSPAAAGGSGDMVGDRSGADGWRTAGSPPGGGVEPPEPHGGVLGGEPR
ncbi:YbaB/EbfC family nucleoid-associated protein [Plantactinospora sp. WMMB334]|uniref:YbaB/EbfC family nucleoid-associated protein n=1 Tax=Plantactinospora sp. WMMB334 TaxID=3404119 RepID=UPI003B928C5E